mgnify:CR=1 FL=1
MRKLERMVISVETTNAAFVEWDPPHHRSELARVLRRIADNVEWLHRCPDLEDIPGPIDVNGNLVGTIRMQWEDTPHQWLITDGPKNSSQDVTWGDARHMVRAINAKVITFGFPTDQIGDDYAGPDVLNVNEGSEHPAGTYRMTVRFASGEERTYEQPSAVVEDCEDILCDVDAEVDM